MQLERETIFSEIVDVMLHAGTGKQKLSEKADQTGQHSLESQAQGQGVAVEKQVPYDSPDSVLTPLKHARTDDAWSHRWVDGAHQGAGAPSASVHNAGSLAFSRRHQSKPPQVSMPPSNACVQSSSDNARSTAFMVREHSANNSPVPALHARWRQGNEQPFPPQHCIDPVAIHSLPRPSTGALPVPSPFTYQQDRGFGMPLPSHELVWQTGARSDSAAAHGYGNMSPASCLPCCPQRLCPSNVLAVNMTGSLFPYQNGPQHSSPHAMPNYNQSTPLASPAVHGSFACGTGASDMEVCEVSYLLYPWTHT